ncbi:DUF58 domain-containing protein [Psychroflexus aestuariivivens]|uniref:DUF58 domain-containing protein n=1 Tax=Psychroflexus aestuariivivens TaxID=1795040 RepID=UPI000FDBCA36|nr:DUF58 domain-containing protein [Psychroflexus aestuariivivens]
MDIKNASKQASLINNLPLLASQVVEGFISGIHKSPFHGYSAEFAEHKLYNKGESTKHIDWKLFAKTDKLYTKKYEEETNLRCHFILDQSSSMYYPEYDQINTEQLDKISFSALSIACIMQLLKKQRDAAGISIYDQKLNFQAREKGSDRHFRMIYSKLEEVIQNRNESYTTNTYKFLHEIAENLKRRSLVFLFSDLFQYDVSKGELFEALRHLKYNKHQVVLFHTLDYKTEVNFDFGSSPKRFFDLETGSKIDLYADQIEKEYKQKMSSFIEELKMTCAKYKIRYVETDVRKNFEKVLSTYLVETQKLNA